MAPAVPQEISTACIHWVLKRAEDGLTAPQIARRVQEMTPAQIRQARAEHAHAEHPKEP